MKRSRAFGPVSQPLFPLLFSPLLFLAACEATPRLVSPTDGPIADAGAFESSDSGGNETSRDAASPAGDAAASAEDARSDAGAETTPDAAPDVHALPADNPFADAIMYLNPDWQAEVQAAADLEPSLRTQIEHLKDYSTAIWLDRIAMVPNVSRYLDLALAQQREQGRPVVTLFVVYDLPNRDCAAHASNGELSLAADGMNRYKTEFIDAIAEQFRAHPDQRIAAIVEPDSLPNLATNLNQPHCAESADGYREAVAYALRELSGPNVFLYLDAAHSGWLGWPSNQTAIATIFRDVIEDAGGTDVIRGFATNVANYTVLHEVQERFDYQSNPCHDEMAYVRALRQTFGSVGLGDKKFVVDTSRNGRGGIRHQWGYWCNNIGAGIGERPVADPADELDAYVWIKPPGESDGTSDPNAARYDTFCGMEDAAPNAPEAGQWFQSYFVELVRNAAPSL